MENEAKYPVGSVGASLNKAPRTESVTEREISGLSKTVSELNMLVDDLQNRLASVLKLQPEIADNIGKPNEPLTALPSAIREQKESISRAIYILSSILSRLEI